MLSLLFFLFFVAAFRLGRVVVARGDPSQCTEDGTKPARLQRCARECQVTVRAAATVWGHELAWGPNVAK